MAFKTYTRNMLAAYTGRPLASFPRTFVEQSAIPQALLLFKLGTCLQSPDHLSAEDKQLVDFAILSMVDHIHLSAPYQAAMASPFNSESLGSYSYSKTASAIRRGEETGVMWFDTAIHQLSVCEVKADFAGGGIEVYEHDATLVPGTRDGNFQMLTPADLAREDPPGSGLYIPQGG